jgi:hypothetical protein
MYIFGARLRYRYGVVRNAHTGLNYYCVRMDLIISEKPAAASEKIMLKNLHNVSKYIIFVSSFSSLII